MDTRTLKSIATDLGHAARYDSKLQIWFVKDSEGKDLVLEPARVESMKPDAFRKLLGAKPERKPGRRKARTEPKPTRAAFDPEAKIKLLVDNNPKRPGTQANAVFSLYTRGLTVGEFIAAGGSYDALRWDVKKKFVAVGT